MQSGCQDVSQKSSWGLRPFGLYHSARGSTHVLQCETPSGLLQLNWANRLGSTRPSSRGVYRRSASCWTGCQLGVGDLLEHVMWRWLRGGLPTKKPPKVVVVQVGMADISLPYGCTLESGEKVGVRAINMLQFLQARFPTSYLIYLAILPKVRVLSPPSHRSACVRLPPL